MARKIVIASGKGGVGKTTVAVGLGEALAARGKKVLLIDCDILGGIDIMLGATEKLVYNWGDVIGGRCILNDALYKTGNISIMTCPKNYRDVSIKSMKLFMKNINNMYDYILLDSPAGTDMGFIIASYVADRGLVVSTPDPVCVRSVCTAADEMRKYNIDDVRLIINRADIREMKKGYELKIDDVIDKTEVQLIGLIPEDDAIRRTGKNPGVCKKGRISYNAFCNIAGRICGDNINLYIK